MVLAYYAGVQNAHAVMFQPSPGVAAIIGFAAHACLVKMRRSIHWIAFHLVAGKKLYPNFQDDGGGGLVGLYDRTR